MDLRLHAFEEASRANGPGLRAVAWFQGCTLKCPDCFNPETHDSSGGYFVDTADLAQKILTIKNKIEGVSISGGEPFQQPEGLIDFLKHLRGHGLPYPYKGVALSTLVFTGYTLEQIKRMPLGEATLSHLDVLIAGPYRASAHSGQGLLGSANQKIHLLTKRYNLQDFTRIPGKEIILHADGSITSTGISPLTRMKK